MSTLSPRHDRFVAEFLRDGNATRAYIRAGYSPRGAQPSSARLMRRPDVAAAIAAGRQRLGHAAELSVERIAHEYARIAFASVDDFMVEGENGRLRVDLAKASAAQRTAIVEIRIRSNHSKQEQEVTLKLGKMQALAALTKQVGLLVEVPEPGLAAEDRDRLERSNADLQRKLAHSIQEQGRLERELRTASRHSERSEESRPSEIPRSARDDSTAMGSAHAPTPDHSCHPERSEGSSGDGSGTGGDGDDPPLPPVVCPRTGASDPQYARYLPLRETTAPPRHVPGLYPDTKFVWSGGRALNMGLDSAEALRRAPRGGFPGW